MKRGSAYGFEDDPEEEQARLAEVEGAFDPLSRSLLIEAGVEAGWRCWEVGAGNGSIARWLSGVVEAHGEVLATDLDDRRFEGGGTNLTFARHDIGTDPLPPGQFDLIHARFLLEHLRDPYHAIEGFRDSLRPGGVLVLEDSSGLRLDISPALPVVERLSAAWEAAGATVGWDPRYGQRLISDLQAAGLSDVRGVEHRRIAPGGAAWRHLRYGLDRLRHQLLDHGVADVELQHVLDHVANPGCVISGPPVMSAYGRR